MEQENWEKLNDEKRQILALMAMIPPPVSLDTLVDLTAVSPVGILRSIEKLQKDQLIAVYNAIGTGFYHIKSAELVEFMLNKIPPQTKQEEGKKLLSFFESHLSEGVKKSLTITHIHQTSGLKPKKFDRILESAEYCLSLGLKDDAASYYRMVVDNMGKRRKSLIAKEQYIDAALGLISVHGHLIPHAEQQTILKIALRFGEDLRDEERLARLSLAYAQILKTTGNYKNAAVYFDRGWIIARSLGKEDLLKKAAFSTTDFLFWQGKISEAVNRYEEVIGNLEEFPADKLTLKACATLGWCYGICGQTARGIGLIEAVRTKAKEFLLDDMVIYADLMTVLALLEARRISEAEAYLDQILCLSEEVLGHYVLWAANAAMAFVLYHNGDLKKCFEFQKRAFEHSKKMGWPHHRGPWNFEYINALEANNMVLQEMSYESELRRIFSWPDIYMKGVAFRYRAQRNLENHCSRDQIYKDLKLSSKFLTKAGAKLELSRTQIFLASLLLEDNKGKEAQDLLVDAWKVTADVNEDIFPSNLKKYIVEESQEELFFKTIVDVGNTIGRVRNQKKLLERIINLIMRFTAAERGGFFLLNDNNELDLVASRNLDLAMVKADWFQANFQIIHQVVNTGKPYIDSGAFPSAASALKHGPIGSPGFRICCPVVLQNQILGGFYMESHLISKQLGDRGLSLLTAIGNQVAIALDNVHAYEEIAELKDRLKAETRFYRKELEFPPRLGDMVGKSKGMSFVRTQIQQVAGTDSAVLISGETGVGKELAARSIHRISKRCDGPFIPINIASLSRGLIESELFGHERGAFTGASRVHRGRFELAHSGTLFLDDIENLSSDIQVKLLRILQERKFERVGGNKTIRSDFRLIAATNRDLERMVKEGSFRPDLYYRMNVFPIRIPPLSERKDDIPLLAYHFLEIYKRKMRKDIKGISRYDIEQLKEYSWWGNVRELQHVIERAVILTTGEMLQLPKLEDVSTNEMGSKTFVTLEDMEKSYIVKVLENCNWIVSGEKGAAKVLGLKPTTLYSKIRRLGIRREVSYVTH